MLHSIQPDKHGAFGPAMIGAIEACVHCGFCLAACPTYGELQQEMDTPRGRIVLMKQVLEEQLPWAAAQPHVDRCLGCLACEPACPSGVNYRDLISPFRAIAKPHFRRSLGEKIRRFSMSRTVPFPNRLRLLSRFALVGRMFRPLLPRRWGAMLDLVPASIPSKLRFPELIPANGERRARVALLLGCGQQVYAPDINTATIDVLTRNGVEVVIPKGQGCCGALDWHAGNLESARRFARRNLAAFPDDVDAVVSNAAGCGSALHEYGLILRGTTEADAAAHFSRRAVDVSRFLARIGLRESVPALNTPLKVAYHDACHLINAQHVRDEPRALLRTIAGLELVELAEAHLCCGSAGSYNVDEPVIAGQLGARKVSRLVETGAELVATGNIGCLLQLKLHLSRRGLRVPVVHTMQLLRDAYRQELGRKVHG